MTTLPTPITDRFAALDLDAARTLWRETYIDCPNARARAARTRRAVRLLAETLGEAYQPHLPVSAYHDALGAVAWSV